MNVGDVYLELSGLVSPATGKKGIEALATEVRNGQLVLPCWVVKSTKNNDAPLLVWHHFEDKSGGPRVLQQVRAFFSIDGKQQELCFPSLSTAHRCLNSKGHATFTKFRVYVREQDGSISSRPYSDFETKKNGGQGYYNSAEEFPASFYTKLDGRLSRIYDIRKGEKKNSSTLESEPLSTSGGELDATATPKPKGHYNKKHSTGIPIQLSEQYNQLFASDSLSIAPPLPQAKKRGPGRPKKIQNLTVNPSISVQQMQHVAEQMILDMQSDQSGEPLILYQEPLLEPAGYQPPPPKANPVEENEQHLSAFDIGSYESFARNLESSNDVREQGVIAQESLIQVLPSVSDQTKIDIDSSQQPIYKLGGLEAPIFHAPDSEFAVLKPISQPPALGSSKVVCEDINPIDDKPIKTVADDCPQTPNLEDEQVLIPKTPQLPEENEPMYDQPIDSQTTLIAPPTEPSPTKQTGKRKSTRNSKQDSKRVKSASVKASKPKTPKKAAGGRKKNIK